MENNGRVKCPFKMMEACPCIVLIANVMIYIFRKSMQFDEFTKVYVS